MSVMWKTVSEDCNLACDYCYYSTCGGKPDAQIRRVEREVLERFVRQYMDYGRGPAVFMWQGGEPLLAGRDFFEEVVRLQAQYAPPHTTISNSLQTNGTLINDKWAGFFKTYNFLIGVSLDGPRDAHDARRPYADGSGSFDRAMRGIEHLRRRDVDFNILTVVHRENVHRAAELMAFYREQRFSHVQFIPCMDFKTQDAEGAGTYEITPEEYGEFLCGAFDAWYADGRPVLSVRFFDNMLSVYINREAELCQHREHCPESLIFEQDGSAYPCDFFINDDWKLGSIADDSLEDLMQSPVWEKFRALKPGLPEPCRNCPWRSLCHGGCPRSRTDTGEGLRGGPDYFCESYTRFYAYAHERMTKLGSQLRRSLFEQGLRTTFGGRLPGRNEPCACGSGKKYKHCCGAVSF
ncbi:anaerobic sulfatase maturase [Saccharibacillus sp. CPCC 101409]|nr:anaerobic sulfatase maturase [Saccharibacillus sp. CPCC 101409]MDO3409333.1 anaerobic sulfatase maturase [Saccharibacillus sp. CPCC 101409]